MSDAHWYAGIDGHGAVRVRRTTTPDAWRPAWVLGEGSTREAALADAEMRALWRVWDDEMDVRRLRAGLDTMDHMRRQEGVRSHMRVARAVEPQGDTPDLPDLLRQQAGL